MGKKHKFTVAITNKQLKKLKRMKKHGANKPSSILNSWVQDIFKE